MHTLASCKVCQEGDMDGGRAQSDLDSETPSHPLPHPLQLWPGALGKVGYL